MPVKSIDQQALGALHRLRSAWIAARTSRINTLRGILRELGCVIPIGAHHAIRSIATLREEADSGIPDALRPAIAAGLEEIRALEGKVKDVEWQIEALGKGSDAIARLRSIPGIGLLTASALFAFVGDVRRFPTGRAFASYLGLTPKESSSGLKRRLGSISKRGDVYLRMLLIHGARATLWHAKKQTTPDRLRAWALELERTRGHNKAATALANKLARIAWAVWRDEIEYRAA